ncbi:NXPE3 [Branchiostoma lanceolatum]|uniref:NXPE3 protein n=1 Tax=Branchiostoma lanceolatum TaxID=7740 RepID=A0A8K0AAT8_BRALA|nr:NXPE3 [Branchiostoma lanceolatum]
MVTDHQNGTYTATFRLLWEGRVTIRIQLVLPRQTIDVVERNRREDPFEMVTFQRRFTVGKKNVDTQCNVDPVIFKDSPVCNYSDPHAGVWWYCVKPVNASCNTSGSQSRLRYKKTKLRAGEEKLFNRDRIKAVRAAIERLRERSPQTLVVIKSANTNTGNMLFEGDWLAQRLDAMMREKV